MASTSTSYDTSRPLRHRSTSYSNIPRFRSKAQMRASDTGINPAFYATSSSNRSCSDLPKRVDRSPAPDANANTRYPGRRTYESQDQSRDRDQARGQAGVHQHHEQARTRTKSHSHLPTSSSSKYSARKDAYSSIPRYTQQQEYQRAWEDLAFHLRPWTIDEELRSMFDAIEAARRKLVQEEFRRIRAELLLRRDEELQRMYEQMRPKRAEDERERVRRQRVASDRIMANAWAIYERNWALISSSSEPLSFATIPWPTLNRPSGPSSITLQAISAFLLSDAHSISQKPKERIREALRRWHPDRFVRFLRRVPLEERGMVEEAVGIVARCLNELMSRYSD